MSYSGACCAVAFYRQHVSRMSVVMATVTSALFVFCLAADRWLVTIETAENGTDEYRLGLFRICLLPSDIRIQDHSLLSPCVRLDYSAEWKSISTRLHASTVFTAGVTDRIRSITPVLLLACTLSAAGTLLAIIGHCRKSQSTSIAAGLFVLAGLLLGGALVALINLLTEEFALRPLKTDDVTAYRLGGCFYACAGCILLAQLSALMLVHSQLQRLHTAADLLKLVPGIVSRQAGVVTDNGDGTRKERAEPDGRANHSPTGAEPVEAASVYSGQARTLPSRGRYAKQVTFKLEERPAAKTNGDAPHSSPRATSTLPRLSSHVYAHRHLI